MTSTTTNDEAVEAAAAEVARHELLDGGIGNCACSPDVRSCVDVPYARHLAEAVLAAAAPLVEARVRQQIAAEIEAARKPEWQEDDADWGDWAFDSGLAAAARVVRGDGQ